LGVRCTANAERELYGLEFLDTQAVLDRLRSVTAEDVQRVARAVHDFGEPALSIVGPLEAAGIPNPE
jgi:predicted Zn-dependent peptidase